MDFLAIAGVVLVSIGIWLIFPPAALIILGVISLATAIMAAR